MSVPRPERLMCVDLLQSVGLAEWRSRSHIADMEDIHRCTSVLRSLIAAGEPNGIPHAEKAINDLMDATPAPRQKASLESVQAVVQEHRDAEGCQLGFADTVNDYIEKLMRSFE